MNFSFKDVNKRQFQIEYEITKIRKSMDLIKFRNEVIGLSKEQLSQLENILKLIKLYDEYFLNNIKLSKDIDKRITKLEKITQQSHESESRK